MRSGGIGRELSTLGLLLALAGCPDAAQKDLREVAAALQEKDLERAGAKIGAAAEKTNAVVETKIDAVADKAVDAAETARAMIDPDAVGRELAAAISCKGSRCTMAKAKYTELMDNPMVLASQLSLSPEQRRGTTRWRVTEVYPGGVAERLDLRTGDLLLRVNGRTLGKTLLAELPKSKKVVIELERANKKVRRELRPK